MISNTLNHYLGIKVVFHFSWYQCYDQWMHDLWLMWECIVTAMITQTVLCHSWADGLTCCLPASFLLYLPFLYFLFAVCISHTLCVLLPLYLIKWFAFAKLSKCSALLSNMLGSAFHGKQCLVAKCHLGRPAPPSSSQQWGGVRFYL